MWGYENRLAPAGQWRARSGARGARQCSTGILRFCGVLALAGTLLLALGGCSAARFGYDHGDTIALASLDHYLDLDAGQKVQAREQLQRLFAWHRAHELPVVAQELAWMQTALDRPTTPADLERLQAATRASVDRTVDQALPALIAFARMLRPEQLAHLRREFERANTDYRDEYLDLSPDTRQRRRLDKFLERMERWFGGFDRRQRAQIGVWLAAVPEDPQIRYAQRVARQQELLALIEALRQTATSQDEARRLVRAYTDRLEWQSAAPGSAEAARDQRAGMVLVAQVINATTPAQKETARKRLQGWREDVASLMAKQVN